MEMVTFIDASGKSRELPWNDNTVAYLAKLSHASQLTVHFGGEFVWIVDCGNWRVSAPAAEKRECFLSPHCYCDACVKYYRSIR